MMSRRLQHIALSGFLTSVVVGLLVLCPLTRQSGEAFAQTTASRDFTDEEKRLLEKGELVARPITQRRGQWNLMGGSSWQVINASPEIVWRALLDSRHYRRVLPRILNARVVTKKPDQELIYIEQGTSIFQVSYYLRLAINTDRKDINFSVDEERPHTLKAGWGFYAVRPYDNNKTMLAYGVMADLGDGIFVSLIRASVHEWMLKVPHLIKRFVEGSGRKLYK
jgi:hypothetical protein